jgi:hypothetical protein
MTPNSDATIYRACQIGDIKTINEFLNSNEFLNGSTMIQSDVMVIYTIKNEKLEALTFLLHKFQLHYRNSKMVRKASNFSISANSFKSFQSIAENFSNNVDLICNLKDGNTLIKASRFGQLEIIKYILNTDFLNKHVDIHVNDDAIFRAALEAKQVDILRYFIFDLNIEITPNIKRMIDINSDISNMFELRNINKSLNNELNNNSAITKKLKV